ncbi:hypothetical protein H490_0103840 [Leucobacter sp. UCD-THU]|uniref:Uncharacterized protein n=1 Tax=Leucobacter muris TaxID=1935379 RepID=A0ABX5QEX1_9MICO|nr:MULTISPECIES: hypothetical protein [Leucobacter]EYT56020.1 hypothetical protein H490_0103840 [Leucobacter sp. UCD-THU]QAB17499.1 hypothetical protein Leucomu_05800 [Leucobacter muris]
MFHSDVEESEEVRFGLEWHLDVIAYTDSGNIIVSSYLRVVEKEGFAQTLSQAVLLSEKMGWDLDDWPEERFRDWVRVHVAEDLYDLSRRAIQSQAAQMDFQFNLELSSPDDVEVHEVRFESQDSSE